MMFYVLFTKVSMLKLRLFCYSRDSRGLDLSTKCYEFMMRYNLSYILQDKLYILSQQRKKYFENTTHLKGLCVTITRN